MPRIEAIIRTAEARIRPVLLTTITTMAGLTPMMLGLSLDFINGGYSIDSPTALWWKQLATAVVFGLGIATLLTLVFTPSLLALRVWVAAGAYRSVNAGRARPGTGARRTPHPRPRNRLGRSRLRARCARPGAPHAAARGRVMRPDNSPRARHRRADPAGYGMSCTGLPVAAPPA
jgi:hypothetical protein